MNNLRLVYNENYIELTVTGLEYPGDSWLMLQGSWSIDGRKMSGQDPSIQLEDIVELQGDLTNFFTGDIDRVYGGSCEPDFALTVNKEKIMVYFLPERTIWNSYPRPEAEKIIYGEIPTFIKPYNVQDAKAILAWTEAVIRDIQSEDPAKSPDSATTP